MYVETPRQPFDLMRGGAMPLFAGLGSALDPALEVKVLASNSEVVFPSGSRIRIFGEAAIFGEAESPDLVTVSDLAAPLVFDSEVVPEEGDRVRLAQSATITLPEDTVFGIRGSDGRTMRVPAGTTMTAFGYDPQLDGGVVSVVKAAPGSTWTPPEAPPEPCPEGLWRAEDGSCVPLVTVTPVVPSKPWYRRTGVVAAGVGAVAVVATVAAMSLRRR